MQKTNIIFILADDMGIGDVKCYHQEAKLETPWMDRMADQGMLFADAHSASAVCTPARYGVITGRYCWRTHFKEGVLYGYDTDLVEADRFTLPKLLQQNGYHTACIGKWHLGMGMPTIDKQPIDLEDGNNVAWNEKITGGPLGAGFDYYYGISASLDMPPYVYIENDHFTAIPDHKTEGGKGNRYDRRRAGWEQPGFEIEEVLPKFSEKAVRYIEEHAKESEPFFLYMPLNSPHTPVAPTPAFYEKSQAGAYGDFVMETDWAIGQVLQAVERSNIAENTLVIVSSDNGPETITMPLRESHGHASAAEYRGFKRDAWEGGHRVPFIAWWKGKISEGTVCDALISQTDLMATCAELMGIVLPHDAGEDSISFLPLLIGEEKKHQRETVIHHTVSGKLSVRQGKWKYIDCQGSGGNVYRTGPNVIEAMDPPAQLYHLENDVYEQENLYKKNPEKVQQLKALLEQYIQSGRSR